MSVSKLDRAWQKLIYKNPKSCINCTNFVIRNHRHKNKDRKYLGCIEHQHETTKWLYSIDKTYTNGFPIEWTNKPKECTFKDIEIKWRKNGTASK